MLGNPCFSKKHIRIPTRLCRLFYNNFSHYSGGISNLDTSVMAKISDGYTIGSIDACIKEVMTCKRKLQLRTQPLTNAELINVLW